MVTRDEVKEKFNENASQYDQQREKLIPCFKDFYSIPVSVLETSKEEPAVLDIGAGTGLLTSFILKKFPKAKVTLIDLSEKMIEKARQRFKNYDNITYIVEDYTKYHFNKKFDMIVSSLSIHHLTDPEKRRLYDHIYGVLKTDGVFINADQVLGQTPFIESLYKNDWKNKIEHSGLTQEELKAAHERTKLDKMATLDMQLNWLKEIGFHDVDCIYKYFNFVVIFARKV
ncbi:class I SAM-dependent methyltransferase [Neobacillus sp. LXY-4]|uniref:class I SAM-dependent methyltransferase n=1 Tax=Neobacillus sp. LXY-4 TaxID=3379826 RepID=UPI003EE3ABC8